MNQQSSNDGVNLVRRYSREMVRELGFLRQHYGDFALTHSQCHALLDLSHAALTVNDLAERLKLEQSSTSRLVEGLLKKRWVKQERQNNDARKKVLTLTNQGKKKVIEINKRANNQVEDALRLLGATERQELSRSLERYAWALKRSNEQGRYKVRALKATDNAQVANLIRTVMTEFGASGPGFAIHDEEVSNMYKAYSGKRSRFYVVEFDGEVVGGGGFGPLKGGSSEVCELRKMYFFPKARGCGMGERLLRFLLKEMKHARFKNCYLETTSKMLQAQALYKKLGFKELCKPMGETGHYSCDNWYSLML